MGELEKKYVLQHKKVAKKFGGNREKRVPLHRFSKGHRFNRSENEGHSSLTRLKRSKCSTRERENEVNSAGRSSKVKNKINKIYNEEFDPGSG